MIANTFQTKAGRLRPKLGFLLLAAAFGLASLTLPIVVALTGTLHPVDLLCPIAAVASALYAFRSLSGARFAEGSLSVGSDRTVRFDGSTLALGEELAQGFVVPTEAGTLVRLERRGVLMERPRIVVRMLSGRSPCGGASTRVVALSRGRYCRS